MRVRSEGGRGRRGAAMVEMAVVLPMIVLLLLGMLEASRMCMVAQLLANAARDGCRVAVSVGKTSQDVTTRINATLTAAGLPSVSDPSVTMALSPSSIETTTLNTPITLNLGVNFNASKVNWLPTAFFFKSSTVNVSAVMLSQRP